MKNCPALLLAVCLALAGCANLPERTIPFAAGGDDKILPSDIVNISLGKGIAERNETEINAFGGTFCCRKYATGQIWQRAFIGKEDAPARLELVSTMCRMGDVSYGVIA